MLRTLVIKWADDKNGAWAGERVMLTVGEIMGKSSYVRLVLVSAAALLAGAIITEAQAQVGGFGISEQSAYFMGSSYAGAAAGHDISSMYWNPAATATLPGFNSSSNYSGILGSAKENATGGTLLTGIPPLTSPGGSSTNVGTDALVPASYWTLQLTDRLYAGLGLNAPFGLVTKPDNTWAGSPLATTTKVFSLDANPTVAYKITPTLTVGAGVQIEYFEIKLEHGALDSPLTAPFPVSPSRNYQADDTSVGATAGVLWDPMPGTTLGLGYRSSVTENVSGLYSTSAFLNPFSPSFPGAGSFVPPVNAIATGKITLPDSMTFSFRQAITPQLTALGTVEWTNWSHVGNISATGAGCPGGVCETLNLNYKDSWFYSIGAEYAYSPVLTLRTGVGYDSAPIDNSNRDILLPDADRIYLSFGATYKWSDKLSFNVAYSHLFFSDESFCMANPAVNPGGTTHCNSSTPAAALALNGTADTSVDIVSLGANYKFYGEGPLEPLK
ncbi:MAG: OmpP1/FadL family transporter [Rhodomicrobium sp.]